MSTSMGGNQGYGSFSKPQKVGKTGLESININQFTPEQSALFGRMFGSVSPDSYTAKLAGGDQDTFNQLEAPALRQFSEFQGGLASRFSGQGGVGANRTSGAMNQQTSAASNFAQDLQAKRTSLMRQATQDLHSMSQDLLGQRPEEQYMYEPQKKQSFWDSILGIGLPAAGAAAGGIFGGPAGAVAGGKIGSAAYQGFRG